MSGLKLPGADLVLPILENIALIALAAVVLFAILRRIGLPPESLLRRLLLGLVLGLISVVVIEVPVAGPQGTTIDGRAGPMIFAGFLGGLPGGLVAAALGGLARWELGGAYAAVGMLSFVLYALAGAGLRAALPVRDAGDEITPARILALMALSFLVTVLSFAAGPAGLTAPGILTSVLPTVLLTNAIAIAVTGLVLRDLLSTVEAHLQLRRLADELRSRLGSEQAASAAKSRFLANLSQEFRTPLNGVIGLAEVLRVRGGAPAQDPLVKRNIDEIYASGRQLLDIIDDILDLTQIEQGAGEIRLQPCAAGEIAEHAAAPMRAIAEASRVHLVLDTAAAGGVLCEPTALTQCLINLISNAIRHAPRGSAVVLSAAPRGERTVFAVTDRGRGIPPEVVAGLGEPFAGTSEAARRLGTGVGLGLALTLHLVRRQGGELTFATGEGRGTTATIALKTAPAGSLPRPAGATGLGAIER